MNRPPEIRRCLVADDEPLIGALLREAIAVQGFAVETAFDGETAAARIAENGYDLVISDVMMPGKTGVEILHEVRAAGRVTPFILMSSYFTDEMMEFCRALGRVEFLKKPFGLSELRAVVSRACAPAPVR